MTSEPKDVALRTGELRSEEVSFKSYGTDVSTSCLNRMQPCLDWRFLTLLLSCLTYLMAWDSYPVPLNYFPSQNPLEV